MEDKKLVINANDFGKSKIINKSVLFAYHNGFLTAASLCVNGNAFDTAVNEIIPECPNLSIGISLNISDGYSLTKAPLLTNLKSEFRNSFLKIFIKSFNDEFMKQLEFEFRTQIETVMNYTKVSFITSQNDIHAIPKIFELTAKLAKEYNIPFIETHCEEIYFVQSLKSYLNLNFPINFVKTLILNFFTEKNKKYLEKTELRTNDNIISNEYRNLMNNSTFEYGLSVIKKSSLTQIDIVPKNTVKSGYFVDLSKELKDKITRMGFEITSYKKEYE